MQAAVTWMAPALPASPSLEEEKDRRALEACRASTESGAPTLATSWPRGLLASTVEEEEEAVLPSRAQEAESSPH